MSDANDGAVLMSGKNLDGSKAGKADYIFAGGGLIIPLVGGSAIKNTLKGFADNIGDFYKKTHKLDLGERIVKYKQAGSEFAEKNDWVRNKQLEKKNKGRTIYSDKNGNNYSLDTQHGAFEVTNKKGKHLGEMKFDGTFKERKLDNSGKHDLKTK